MTSSILFRFLSIAPLVDFENSLFLDAVQSSYHVLNLPDAWFQSKMLLGFLAASFLLLALISWGKKKAKFRLPGAGPYIPFIGHYEVHTILLLDGCQVPAGHHEVHTILLLALISWVWKRAKFRLPGAGPYIPFIGHYEVHTILLLALISWVWKRAKFRLPGAGPYIPFIGHYEVHTILLLALIS
jgi:hypothetical protein